MWVALVTVFKQWRQQFLTARRNRKNKGIVPISMNEIFERVAQQKSETKSFEVSASIIEIYNEKI